MLFSETGKGNSNPSGGYVRYAIREMTTSNRAALSSLIGGLDINDDKGNSAEYALAMHEAYLYFKGRDARSGHNKVKRDEAAFNPNPRYRSPVIDVCAKNYVIFISNGAPDNGENSTAAGTLNALGGRLRSDPIALNPSTRQANWSDEYARFMAANDINTYVIDVNPLSTGQGPANTALLKSMANQGSGKYYAVFDAADLKLALENALNEMQAVDSVYASTALPVSVNVRGTYLNEVYMAVFRPDENARPRWLGNLKLYQLAVDASTDALFLADSLGQPAQSPVSGFIRSDAVSFWTGASSYWEFSPRGNPESASDSPDGEVVEKGGSAQAQRAAWPDRTLYTCTGDCSSPILMSFEDDCDDNPCITAAELGVQTEAERTALIDWVRGADNTVPAERDASEVRPSLHGDVVHSRPTVVNYNRGGDDSDIVVFYGANDGLMRAMRGGRSTEDGGNELWGFVAPEFFNRLKRLRDGTPNINVPSDPEDPEGNKPYFMDGNMSVYVRDVNGDGRLVAAAGDKAYLYASMRRGGRHLYAFDVSAPENPSFLWKRSHTDDGYGELGQTWSEAKVAQINLAGVETPVLIMGAGYDQAADDLLPSGTNTMGRGVFVINALTGSIIWQAGPSAGMTHSIPADLTVLDRDRDGFVDRLYAVDTGANVWRVDIGDSDPANWQVHRLATLADTGTVNARKFLFPPDVVYAKDANGPYDAVLVGSGDRERPFDETVSNHFYMLKDRMTGLDGSGQTTIMLSELYDASENQIQAGDAAQRNLAQAEMLASRGWYIRLDSGEKVVGSAVTIAGNVFFSTNQPTPPDPDTCSGNLGIARIYVVSYSDARPTASFGGSGTPNTAADRSTIVPGGGLLPSPTPIIVQMGDISEDEDEKRLYQTVCFGPHCIAPPDVELDRRQRVYWYRCTESEGGSATGACD
jgi:type IV pilus assembly protein PilY1